MRKDTIDIILGEQIKRRILGKDTPKYLVLKFDKTFLSESVGITKKDKSVVVPEKIKLKPVRIGKFKSIVNKNDRGQS